MDFFPKHYEGLDYPFGGWGAQIIWGRPGFDSENFLWGLWGYKLNR